MCQGIPVYELKINIEATCWNCENVQLDEDDNSIITLSCTKNILQGISEKSCNPKDQFLPF